MASTMTMLLVLFVNSMCYAGPIAERISEMMHKPENYKILIEAKKWSFHSPEHSIRIISKEIEKMDAGKTQNISSAGITISNYSNSSFHNSYEITVVLYSGNMAVTRFTCVVSDRKCKVSPEAKINYSFDNLAGDFLLLKYSGFVEPDSYLYQKFVKKLYGSYVYGVENYPYGIIKREEIMVSAAKENSYYRKLLEYNESGILNNVTYSLDKKELRWFEINISDMGFYKIYDYATRKSITKEFFEPDDINNGAIRFTNLSSCWGLKMQLAQKLLFTGIL
jgi:hypothetical protein